MLENELITEVLQAVNSGIIPSGWNDTTIGLTLKVENPEKLHSFALSLYVM